MNISQAAAAAGLTAKMVRYYEQIGLLQPPPRSQANYRRYRPEDVATMAFIAQARRLGFSLDEVASLLALRQRGGRTAADVRALASSHVTAIGQRIAELQQLKQQLDRLIAACHHASADECPILDALEGHCPAEQKPG